MSAWSAAMGLGCRKNGCGVWCGDDRKTTRWDASREARDDGRDRGRPGSPDKEHLLDPGERRRQRIGVRQIRDDDLDAGEERRGRRPADERADRTAESEQRADDGPSHAASRADDQDGSYFDFLTASSPRRVRAPSRNGACCS